MGRKVLIMLITSLSMVPFIGGIAAATAEFRVNTYVTDGQMYPSVAMNPAGNAVVVWYSLTQDGGTRGVYGQRLDANGNFAGSEFQANTYTADVQDWPTVAICEAGRFVVVWTSYGQDGSDAGIYAQLFDANGSKLFDEIRVNTYTTDRQKYPVVAMDNNGRFVVAWQSRYQDGSEDGIYAQRFDNHGQALGSEFRVNTVTQGYQMLPAIAMNADGKFVIAWMRDLQDGNGGNISMQRYAADGTQLGGEVSVNGYWTDDQSNPAVAIDALGGVVVAWDSQGQDGDSDGIYAQMFNPNGTPHGGEFHVSTEVAHAQSVPSIAMHAAGHFLIFWQSDEQDGSQWGVFGQAFDANGAQIGSEFQFNTYTAGMQMMPATAINAEGDFLVAWMSEGQDGSGQGIYAAYDWIENPASVFDAAMSPQTIALHCPSPVSVGESSTFSLTLSRPGAVELSIHDVRGRLVHRLIRNDLSVGAHAIPWNGACESGRPVPSGVYFVRATAQGAAATGRIIILQ